MERKEDRREEMIGVGVRKGEEGKGEMTGNRRKGNSRRGERICRKGRE
jgi:hypothetical protein